MTVEPLKLVSTTPRAFLGCRLDFALAKANTTEPPFTQNHFLHLLQLPLHTCRKPPHNKLLVDRKSFLLSTYLSYYLRVRTLESHLRIVEDRTSSNFLVRCLQSLRQAQRGTHLDRQGQQILLPQLEVASVYSILFQRLRTRRGRRWSRRPA